jgi:hypothetical protein
MHQSGDFGTNLQSSRNSQKRSRGIIVCDHCRQSVEICHFDSSTQFERVRCDNCYFCSSNGGYNGANKC